MKYNHPLHRNQSGLVSIIVTMLFISIITLMTVSFAFLMRRERQQVLDRQLSTQAFYAAESAISDKLAEFDAPGSTAGLTDTTCDEATQPGSIISGGGNVRYTCVLYNQTPDELEANIGVDEFKVLPVRSANGNRIRRIEVSWSNEQDSKRVFSDKQNFSLPQLISGTDYSDDFADEEGTGVLRTTIIPVPIGGFSHDLLRNISPTYFLYPLGDAPNQKGSIHFLDTNDLGEHGDFVSGRCNADNTNQGWPRYCNAEITGLNAEIYYLRLKSLYQPSSVVIRAFDIDGNQLPLEGAQVEIDATGQASDVLRRIKVRVPVEDNFLFPDFAIDSADSICKRLVAWPDGARVLQPDNARYIDEDEAERACNLTN